MLAYSTRIAPYEACQGWTAFHFLHLVAKPILETLSEPRESWMPLFCRFCPKAWLLSSLAFIVPGCAHHVQWTWSISSSLARRSTLQQMRQTPNGRVWLQVEEYPTQGEWVRSICCQAACTCKLREDNWQGGFVSSAANDALALHHLHTSRKL